MARLEKIHIENYRSIKGPLKIDFPLGAPLVLIGENNTGKSNIVRAVNLVLGQFWPGNHDPEDHEFYNRSRSKDIRITLSFAKDCQFGRYNTVFWKYDADAKEVIFGGYPPLYPGKKWGFISNEDRDSCVCILIDADRELRHQLSYRSKYTLLSRLMQRFHKALLDDEVTKTQIEELFEDIKAKFYQIPSFKDFADRLKGQLSDFVSTMTHSLEVDFEAYNPVNFFHALRLQATEGGHTRTLEEMGTGEQQVLALSFAFAYAKAFHGGLLLAVEEPEAHLHPLAQEWLCHCLNEMAQSGLQMLLTSHSPHFVDIMNIDGLVLVRKASTGTVAVQKTTQDLVNKCIETGVPSEKVAADNIRPFYRVNSTADILGGFFATAIVLVEGETEALSLPVLLRQVGLNTKQSGIAVLSVRGKGNLAKWKRLYDCFEIPTYLVFDNDGKTDPVGTKRRDVLKSLGMNDELSERYISIDRWHIDLGLSIFGTDYEGALRSHFSEYSNLEAEARRFGAHSKPFIARWVAEKLDPTSGDDGWEKMREMSKYIEKMIQ